MKKIILFFVCGLALGWGNLAIAADSFQNPAEVYVKRPVLRDSTVKAGESVDGAVTFINARSEPVSGILYHLILMKRDQTGQEKVYDDTVLGPETLNGNESKAVHFTYKVPRGVSGGATLRIRAVLQTGFKMGWADVPLTIIGGAQESVTVTDVALIINKKEYNVSAGPTVHPTDEAVYRVTLKNDGPNQVTITPTFSIFKKSIGGELARTVPLASVTLAPKKDQTLELLLPKNLQPDSYEVKVVLKNEVGMSAGPLLSFRYIVGGDILTFQSVSSDKKTLKAGDTVGLTIFYTGTPIDITGTEPPPVGEVSLTTTLTDEAGNVLGKQTSDQNFDLSSGKKEITLPVTKPAHGFSVSLSASKGGIIIATYNNVISLPATEKQDRSTPPLLVLCGVLILVLVIFFIWKGRTPRAVQISLLFLVMCATFFLGTSKAHAFVVTNSFNDPGYVFHSADWRPNVFINTPFGTLAPGEHFHLTGDVEILACHNKPSDIGFTVSYLNNTSWTNMGTTTRGTDNSDEHYTYSYTDTFSLAPDFVAPTTPGTYRIYLRVFNNPRITEQTGGGGGYGWVEGYQEFTVSQNTPPSSSATIKVSKIGPDGTLTALPRVEVGLDTYMSHFKFEETGTALVDSSGNNNTGTLSGAYSRIPSMSGLGNALNFTGGHATVPNSAGLDGMAEGSMSLWVKWNGTQSGAYGDVFGPVLSRQEDGSFSTYLALDNANPANAHIIWTDQIHGSNILTSTNTVGNNTWHHIVITLEKGQYFGSTHKMYIDGTLIGQADSGSLPKNETIPLILGGWEASGGVYANATIDDFRTYNRPLTQAEVTTLAGKGDVPVPNAWKITNPANFQGVSVVDHNLMFSPDAFPSYDARVASCMYDPSSEPECTPVFSPSSALPHCDGVTCRLPVIADEYSCYGDLSACISAGKITKVYVEYSAQTSCPITSWQVKYYKWAEGGGDAFPVWSNTSQGPLTDSTVMSWYGPSYQQLSATLNKDNLSIENATSPFPGNHHYGAHYTATLTQTEAKTFPLLLRADDDSWFYVNGQLVASTPGVHWPETSPVTSVTIPAGTSNIDVFYADRQPDNSTLTLGIGGNCFDPQDGIVVRRVGLDGSQISAPTGGSIKIDATLHASTTEVRTGNVDETVSHDVSASGQTSDGIIVASCLYQFGQNECSIANSDWSPATCSAGFCPKTISVGHGQITKVVYKYGSSTPQSFDYNLSGPAELHIPYPNRNGIYNVNIALVQGQTAPVTLTPEGTAFAQGALSGSWQNPVCSPTCTRALKISLGSSIDPGTDGIQFLGLTIKGTASGVGDKTVPFKVVADGSGSGNITGSCVPTDSSGANLVQATIGQQVVWKTTITNGQPNDSYSYTFTDNDSHALSGSSLSPLMVTTHYDRVGEKIAQIAVTGPSGSPQVIPCRTLSQGGTPLRIGTIPKYFQF